jgi:hypothetical protein
LPQTEAACDGKDNNCDGRVDENDPVASTLCYPKGAAGCDMATGKCVGVCAFGHQACQASPVTGKGELACVDAVTPTPELCNGKDDDCDGGVDEDFPSLKMPCNTESCQGPGVYVCNAQGTDVQCTVTSTGPTPEICDGIDNDCDGVIDNPDANMPGVGISCGSAVGECRQGVSACVAGHIVCNGDVGPTPEICNGKDDNCNNWVDEDVVPPASACNPPGVPSGAALQGECKAGYFQCQGAAGWVCVAGVGPSPEICDGKDNDCDGLVDNNADCGKSAVCLGGECVPLCAEVEYPCSPDRICQNGLCLRAACVANPCAAGQLCDAKGNCYDPCAKVSCQPGATCQNGVCQDCYALGCPTGQICHNQACESDPCLNVHCGSGQYCANGTCLASCASLTCPDEQSCRLGQCVADPCADINCTANSYCNPATAKCLPGACLRASCPAGTVCVETTGQCEANPCEVIRCQDPEKCLVQPDGHAECLLDQQAVKAQVKAGSRGVFGCTVAGRGTRTGAEFGAWMLVLLGLVRCRSRSRSR